MQGEGGLVQAVARRCRHCGGHTPQHVQLCSWDCHIAHYRAKGYDVRTPNGLPIRVIKDGKMLEHEHGDHQDYKFPVTVEHVGGIMSCAKRPDPEEHALLYANYDMCVTMYEDAYATWSMREGRVVSGLLWKPGEWRLSTRAKHRILTYLQKKGRER